MEVVLWLLAVVLVVGGMISVVRSEPVLGVILILLAVLVGPGGVSLLA